MLKTTAGKILSSGALLLVAVLALTVCATATGQSKATTRFVFDDARVFTDDAGEKQLNKLENDLATLSLDTGAQLIFKTVSVATGETAAGLARKVASESLDASKPGAVMVYIRADDSIGVAVTAGSSKIPEYAFATVSKAPGSRAELTKRTDYTVRSVNDLMSVFTKYYGPDQGGKDPRKRADAILMVSVVVSVFLLVFGFVFVQWRWNNRPAAAAA